MVRDALELAQHGFRHFRAERAKCGAAQRAVDEGGEASGVARNLTLAELGESLLEDQIAHSGRVDAFEGAEDRGLQPGGGFGDERRLGHPCDVARMEGVPHG